MQKLNEQERDIGLLEDIKVGLVVSMDPAMLVDVGGAAIGLYSHFRNNDPDMIGHHMFMCVAIEGVNTYWVIQCSKPHTKGSLEKVSVPMHGRYGNGGWVKNPSYMVPNQVWVATREMVVEAAYWGHNNNKYGRNGIDPSLIPETTFNSVPPLIRSAKKPEIPVISVSVIEPTPVDPMAWNESNEQWFEWVRRVRFSMIPDPGMSVVRLVDLSERMKKPHLSFVLLSRVELGYREFSANELVEWCRVTGAPRPGSNFPLAPTKNIDLRRSWRRKNAPPVEPPQPSQPEPTKDKAKQMPKPSVILDIPKKWNEVMRGCRESRSMTIEELVEQMGVHTTVEDMLQVEAGLCTLGHIAAEAWKRVVRPHKKALNLMYVPRKNNLKSL